MEEAVTVPARSGVDAKGNMSQVIYKLGRVVAGPEQL
jgi:hypothetical protein